METVSSFEEMTASILKKRGNDSVITVGILVADWRQDEARNYILNYMNMFDEHSGKYFDFYIPGYYSKKDNFEDKKEIGRKYHPFEQKMHVYDERPAYTIRRNDTAYYFNENIFLDFLNKMDCNMGIKYTYNPMLILVETRYDHLVDKIRYGDHVIIELDEDNNRGLRRSGQLFDAIFEIAKRKLGLGQIANGVKLYYIKGDALGDIVHALLKQEWLEAVADAAEIQHRFRIRKAN